MTTALTLIKSSLRKLGVLGVGQSLAAEEAQDALESLNAMLEMWSIQGNSVYTTARETFTLTAGQASYTIGTGGNLNTTRPVQILDGFTLLPGGSQSRELDIIDQNQYANITDKTRPGYPEALYYDGNSPLGNVILWPVPVSNITLSLYSYKSLAQFANLNTDMALPPGYSKAIAFNLAVDLAPEYEREATPGTIRQALLSKKAITVANTRNQNNQATVDPVLTSNMRYDILGDRWQ